MQSAKWKYIFTIMILTVISVWLAVFTFPDKNLRLISCNVGQGDATLVIYGKTQILIDGGPDNKVLECLSEYIPFWDREIEMVILSHPQVDHFTGLIEVFGRYKVDYFLANGLDFSGSSYSLLKNLVGGSGAKIINPTRGMMLRSGLIQLDILNPSQQYLEENSTVQITSDGGILGSFTSKKDPNVFSIVAILSYKDFNAIFTGDIDNKISDEIAEAINENYKNSLEYIKVPHHGSKNGLTKKLLDATSPEVAVISVKKNNSYGHPHEEILKLLSDRGIKILRTDEVGNIEIISDGKSWWLK
jgi:competence protein ComEC